MIIAIRTGSPRWLLAMALAVMLAGCATQHRVDFGPDPERVELRDTPFYPQQQYQCGPAALMTVLSQSGAAVSLDELVSNVYLPGRKGSLQTEIIASARQAERIPYRIDGSLEDLMAELRAGRAVLVLQNLGVGWFPRWHYAVVYGIDPGAQKVWLRSGTEAARGSNADTFLRTWSRSERWAVVILRPDELPAKPDPEKYFAAVAAMEATGHLATARTAWTTALARWPGEITPLFGLANTELAEGRFEAAERHYRVLLERDSEHAAARNNLAHALAATGRIGEARAELESALRIPGLDSFTRAELQDSLQEIAGAGR